MSGKRKAEADPDEQPSKLVSTMKAIPDPEPLDRVPLEGFNFSFYRMLVEQQRELGAKALREAHLIQPDNPEVWDMFTRKGFIASSAAAIGEGE